MLLALVATLLPADTRGGAEEYAVAAARSLARRHDVVILTGSKAPGPDGLTVVRLPGLPLLPPESRLPRRVLWHARDQWLPSVHVSLSRELRRIAPDVVFTHHPQGLSAAVFTAAARRGLPHVHTAHDFNLMCARLSMTRDGAFCGGRCGACAVQRRIRGGAARSSVSRLIGISRYVSQRHVDAGIVPPERAVTIRHGARPGRGRLRGAEGEALRLGFIGALETHKGVQTLLEAFRRARSPWRLLIAGAGRLEAAVREQARQDERITYVGYAAGSDKEAFFDQLDVLAIPSEWEEPAGLVAVEAAVRGIPAAVSDRGGLPETPEARVFRAGSPGELVRALDWFAERGHIRERSERLLAAQPEFLWSTHVDKVEKLLESVVVESRS